MHAKQQIQFNEVVIIESLPLTQPQTGTTLYDHLQSRHPIPVAVSLHRPQTADELFAVLDAIAIRAQAGGWVPLIHLEVHGTLEHDGIVTASEERIRWIDLATPLRHLNIAVHNSVIVVLGVCSGAYILTAAANSPFEPAPFCWLVGPDRPVLSFFLPVGFKAFYSELLSSGNFAKAVAELRLSALPEYVALDAAKLFRTGWRVYEETKTRGRTGAKRVKRIFRRTRERVVAEFGSNNKARAAIAREIKDTARRRREYYRHFIMADIYPDNEKRFPDIDEEYARPTTDPKA